MKINENYIICKKSLKPFIKIYTKLTKKQVKFIKDISEVKIEVIPNEPVLNL